MQSFENALYKFLSYACAFLILAMTLLIFWQVVARWPIRVVGAIWPPVMP